MEIKLKTKALGYDKCVIAFYKYTVLDLVPISPIKVRVFKSHLEYNSYFPPERGHVQILRTEYIDFEEQAIDYPFLGTIELSGKIKFKFKKKRDIKRFVSSLVKTKLTL
ncbi:hypothetical protein ACIQLG_16960 [Terribacillus saccharophilus]|uniref:hypothetical protein n=1 Tax=Terribacillus saccharophilus TaxID=361277 RepID=UPI0037FD4AD2